MRAFLWSIFLKHNIQHTLQIFIYMYSIKNIFIHYNSSRVTSHFFFICLREENRSNKWKKWIEGGMVGRCFICVEEEVSVVWCHGLTFMKGNIIITSDTCLYNFFLFFSPFCAFYPFFSWFYNTGMHTG